MKNLNNLPLYILLSILFFSSCNKTLNLSPPDSVTDDSYWKTPNDFKLAANKFYFTFPNQDGWDRDADIQYGNGQNPVSAGVNMPVAVDGFWDDRYAMLRQINHMLQKATEYTKPDEIKTYIAEAKFFRAYEYFRLVMNFGDVPYFDKQLTVSSKELFGPRNSRDTVIQKVLQDLDDAIPNLPLESETSGFDQGRITKGAAQSLKAKVALFEATWAKYHNLNENVQGLLDKAINAANDVVGSNQYELFVYTANPDLSYQKSYGIEGNDSKEQVLARRYDPNVEGNWWVNWVCCGGESDPTKKLADMYLSKDGLPISKSPLFMGYGTLVSEFQNRDLRMTNTILIPGLVQYYRDNQQGKPVYSRLTTDEQTGYRVNKLIANYPDGFQWGRAYEFKHVIKYSEVLLILAEALYERNQSISDADLNRTINVLRRRGGVAPLTNALATANELDVLQQIRNERTVELAFDGTRLQDLKRWKTAVTELNQDIKGVNIGSGAWDAIFANVSQQFPKDALGFKIVEPKDTRKFAERNYLFPLPTQQIQLNPQLKQNKGWQ